MLKIDKDLLKDINFEDLDFTLVDRYQKFLFLNVDDYSVAIAKLLLKYRPDKKIILEWGDHNEVLCSRNQSEISVC